MDRSKSDRFARGLVAGVMFGVGGYLGIMAHPIYILIFSALAWPIGMRAVRGY